MPEQLQNVVENLRSFGPKRLAILAAVAVLVMVTIGVSSYYLNKPAYETLYVGLDRSDVNQIGLVLGEAGISFDVDAKGTSILVPAGKAARARMLLAEKGLPTSANAGYELFDNVGSLGLTSFMQQVTRVRALEGEIARTIQSINGVKSARVHIVMPERANFRREEQQPTASVMIRTSGIDARRTAMSIRFLVAAAVPGLNADKVTVLDTMGTLLAAGDDPANNTANHAFGVEQTVESEIESNINRALAPYLGAENFRASVKAVVDTDQKQIEETIFDPDSRVERSVQTVRTNDNSNRQQASTPVSVEQNLPTDQPTAATEGPKSTESRDRREETTNYEINSKKIATKSDGFSISKLSIAVVVNRQRLLDILGKGATDDAINARIAEIKKVVASATGFDDKRGDNIDIAAVEFVDGLDGAPADAPGIMDRFGQHVFSLINAAAFVLVAFLVTWFGLKPLAAALGKPAPGAPQSFEEVQRSLPAAGGEAQIAAGALTGPGMAPSNPIDELRQKLRPAPQERLTRMVDLNEERTAHILRKWAHQEAA
ncbi:flagellar basal-body MS-ring/collar protein FliF [Mesorhizobium koreense]|uniref:flagellar basal-body MS-ring/collar protein FliF n=1 Tax=Mesorhizobium koreense TaxID=3074855 RepID=UPI00287B955F|nr:flagellar basal-body MS-ring/collar protein FliF [Mesorhizobium sp. WR6]